MTEKRMQDWLNTAVSGIRFKPDREAVEEELRGHFEDKVADLQRFYHISQDEAEEMALERMGNAEEIGREMARIHKPWLGYLWRLSQCALVAVTVVVFLCCLMSGVFQARFELRDTGEDAEFRLSCQESLRLGQYIFQVKDAWWEEKSREVTVVWKVTSLVFWEPIGHMPGYYWSAEDDLENHYPTYSDWFHGYDRDGARTTWGPSERDGFGWRVEQTIPNVPRDLQWLRLTFDGMTEKGSVLLKREVAQ